MNLLKKIALVSTMVLGANLAFPLFVMAEATSSGQAVETIQPGILQLTNVPSNFHFSAVTISSVKTYYAMYVNQQTEPEKLTAEDRRFSGGFEVQVTATQYVGQNDSKNKMPVNALGVLTQVYKGSETYTKTTKLTNAYASDEGQLMTGSQNYGAVLTQTLPFSFPVFGHESNALYICTTGIIIHPEDAGKTPASDFEKLCRHEADAPPGNYAEIIPYAEKGAMQLSTQTDNLFDSANGVYYSQPSENEAHIRYKANIRDANNNPQGSVEFTVFLFRDGRIEYHYGPNSDSAATAFASITDNATQNTVQASDAPLDKATIGSDYANKQIRFSPSSNSFKDIFKPGTPTVYSPTNAASAENPDNYTIFTEDPQNPGFSVPTTVLDGAACSFHGRLGNYTLYPSFLLQISPTTPADTYANTITFTIIDKTLSDNTSFCRVQ